ncbi:MAG: (2Fe-2S)-binding protein [Rhodospirillales bacterium]|nr:(2Fe-2S)-binding protein [Rhodospirillales bacterium]
MTIQVTINGEARTLDASPDMPLLWALRDELKMTGTKFGCGVGLCGACTVHLNGSAVRSCQTYVGDVEGAEITTIEAVDTREAVALRTAWAELDVPQCGYCQSGQIMQAADLLKATPKPTDADIDAAMDGNVCRCATYHRIRAGIHRAAEILEA